MRKAGLFFVFIISIINSYSQTPDWQWAKSLHTGEDELSHDVVADPLTNDVYIIGTWHNSLSAFLPSGAEPSTDFTAPYGQDDGLVAKYDSDGNLLWAFKVGGPGDDFIDEIVLDPSGNIYITGYLGSGANPAYFSGISPHTGSSTLTNISKDDFFVAKYNSDGEFQWVRRSINDGDDILGLDLYATSSALYVTGNYSGTCTLGALSVSQTFGGTDLFVIKYDLDGNEQWLIFGGSSGDDFADGVIADDSNVYVTGDYKGVALDLRTTNGLPAFSLPSTNAGKEEIFIFSYDLDGIFKWAVPISSDEEEFAFDIAMDSDSIYITGGIEGGSSFPGYSTNPVFTTSNRDVFLSSHSKTNGLTGWVNTLPCSDGGSEYGRSITITQGGRIILAGNFQGDLTFPGPLILSSAGSRDVFVAAYKPNGVFEWAVAAGSGGDDIGYGVSSGSDGSIYASGSYRDEMDLGLLTLPNDGGDNLFFAKLQEPCTDAIGGTITSTESEICQGESISITLTGYSGDIQWQRSPAGENTWLDIPGETNPVLTITPPVDTLDYRAYLTSGSCNPDSSNVLTIISYEVPVADAGPGGEVCGLSIGLQAIPSVGSGLWSVFSGPGSISFTPSDSDPIVTATTSLYGSYELKWIETNGVCSDSSSIAVIYTDDPASDAGADDEICISDGSYPLIGTSSANGAILWTTSGDGTFSDPAIDNPIYTFGSETGSVTLTKTVSSPGSCADAVDFMILTLTPVPASDAGSDDEICISDGSYPIIGTSSANGSILWTTSGDGTFSDPAIDNPIYTFGSETGSVTLTKTVSSPGSCADAVDFMILTLTPVPASDAGSDDEICISDGSYPIIGTTSSNGAILWATSGNGSFDDPGADNPTYTLGSETGSVTLTKTVSSPGSCADAVDFMILTLTPVTASDAGADDEICISDGSYPIIGTSSANGAILWTTSGDGTFSDPAIDNPIYTFGSETGSVTLTKTVSSPGSCADAVDFMILTLTPVPASDAGSDDEICISDGSYPIIGTTSSNGAILWATSGDGTFSDPAIDNPVYTVGSETGSVTLTKTVSSPGSCADAVDFMILTLTPVPASDAGADDEICISDGSYPIIGTSSANGAILWTTSGDGLFSDPAIDNPVYTVGSETGTVTLTKTISSPGSCADAVDFMILTLTPVPASDAGADDEICISDGSYPIIGTSSANGAILWTTSGNGSFDDPGADNPTYTLGSEIGSVTLTKTVSSPGSCADAVDFMILTLTAVPASDAGADDEICISDGSYPIIGTSSANGAILWTTSGDGTFSDPAIDNPIYTFGSETGSVTLTKTVSSPGSCADAVDFMILTLSQLPISDAGSGGEECDLDYDLRATPSVGTGTWTMTLGSGTATFSPDENSPLATVTVSDYGNKKFAWTEVNGSCNDSDTISVSFYEQPTVDAGSGGIECDLNFKLGATLSTGMGRWVKTSGPGTTTFSPSDTDPSATLTVSEYGSYEITWIEQNGPCSPSMTITIIFLEQPEANAGIGGEECDLDFQLQAAPSVGSGAWSLTSGPGIATFDPSNIDPLATVSVSAFGTYEFAWTETNGVCSDMEAIIVTFYEPPAAYASAPDEVCGYIAELTATLSSGSGTWSKESGPGNVSFANSTNIASNEVTVDEYGTYTFTWTEINGPCSNYITLSINFLETPNPNAGNDAEACGLTYEMQATEGLVPGTWILATGLTGSTFSPSETDPNAIVTVPDFGEYEFIWQEANSICSGEDVVSITFYEPPIADAGPDQVMDYKFSTSMNAIHPSVGTGIWESDIEGIQISNLDDPNAEIMNLAIGDNNFVWRVVNGTCPASIDEVIIRVNDIITPTVITPNEDGLNDELVFPGLEDQPGSKLTIYNRWGTEIYRNPNYQNDWKGKDHKDRELQSDTYYYILNISNGRIIKGFIEIRR